MTISSPARTTVTADSSMTLKAVRPAKTAGKVKRFLNTLMRSLASAHA